MSNTPLNLEQLVSATEEDTIPYELFENDPIEEKPDDQEEGDEGEPEGNPAPEPDPAAAPEPDPESAPQPDPEPTEEDPETKPEQNLEGYYNFLDETGFMDPGEEFKFEGTIESFKEGITKTRENMLKGAAETLSSRLDPELKDYVKHKVSGGIGSLREYYSAGDSGIDLDNVDLSTKQHQRAIVAQNFKITTAFNDKKITKLVDQMDASGDLEVEANEALETLKKYSDDQKAAYLAAQDKALKEYRTTISSAIDELEYIPASRKTKIKNFAINTVGREDGELTDFQRRLASIAKNPAHQAQLADLVFDYAEDKGFDFSRFEKKGKTA